MTYPVSTGQGARIINTTEPRLAETVRRGKIQPEPAIRAGRRLWERHHLIQAAEALGLLTSELRHRLEMEAVNVP